MPVDFEDHKLVVAFAEPADDDALAAVGHATSYEVIPAVADRGELMRAIDDDLRRRPTADAGADAPASDVVGRRRAVADELHINDLLDLVIQWGGSDLHLTSGSPPVIRVHGDLRPVTELPILNGSQIRQMVFSILTQKQREKFENELELDTSYALPGRGRFRVNVFLQRDSVGCVMRAIPYDIVDFDAPRRPARGEDVGVPAARPRARHRPDRFRQVDDARVADRHREPRALGAHHDGRGPDRVPALRTSAR